MKSVILLALVAFAAAVPLQTTPQVPNQVVGGFFGQQNGSLGNIYQVAQYIAYQFNQFQQLKYTPVQVTEYLLEQGFPQNVANFFAQQYETGLTLPYFQAPYLIFQYFYEQGVPQEVEQYIAQQIGKVYQLFQNYYSQNGQQAYEQVYSGVPVPFSQFIIEFGRYYNQNGVTSSSASYAYQQLLLSEQYIQNIFQYFQTQQRSQQQVYQYIYNQLESALRSIQTAKSIYQSYQSYNQFYVPYYAVQYYGVQTQQIYQYLQNVYLYIQQQQYVFPQYVTQQVQQAYFAALNAYQAYQPRQYLYGQGLQYEAQSYQYNYGQVYQYVQYLLQYVQQQVAQGVITQEYASYIIQQLELIQQAVQSGYVSTNGNGYQQIFQYYQNILRYIQNNSIVPQYFIQYFTQRIQFVLQLLQGVQQRNFGGYFSRYFNQSPSYVPSTYSSSSNYGYGSYNPSYGSYNSNYGYQGPYTSSYGYGSSSYPYQYGSYGSYGYKGLQNVGYPYSFNYGRYPYVSAAAGK